RQTASDGEAGAQGPPGSSPRSHCAPAAAYGRSPRGAFFGGRVVAGRGSPRGGGPRPSPVRGTARAPSPWPRGRPDCIPPPRRVCQPGNDRRLAQRILFRFVGGTVRGRPRPRSPTPAGPLGVHAEVASQGLWFGRG